ncbi:MAG: hypothetical protein AB7U86_02120 [Methylocystis sp.]
MMLATIDALFTFGYFLGWSLIWFLSFGRCRPQRVSEDLMKLKPLSWFRFKDEDGVVVLSEGLTAMIGATIIVLAFAACYVSRFGFSWVGFG